MTASVLPASATCSRCSGSIQWVPDDPAVPTIGWWVGGPFGSEVCVPGPDDEDGWHQPVGALEANGWPS